jgi:hypothetical protein
MQTTSPHDLLKISVNGIQIKNALPSATREVGAVLAAFFSRSLPLGVLSPLMR